MSITPNTSRDQGSPEEPAATAGPEPKPGEEVPVITLAEVMLSTAAAQRWVNDVSGGSTGKAGSPS